MDRSEERKRVIERERNNEIGSLSGITPRDQPEDSQGI